MACRGGVGGLSIQLEGFSSKGQQFQFFRFFSEEIKCKNQFAGSLFRPLATTKMNSCIFFLAKVFSKLKSNDTWELCKTVFLRDYFSWYKASIQDCLSALWRISCHSSFSILRFIFPKNISKKNGGKSVKNILQLYNF